MKRNACLLLTIVFWFTLFNPFELYCSSEEIAPRTETVSESPYITKAKETRDEAIGDYDATNDYIFFAYSERIAVVDAYDMNGNYVFSIQFDQNNRGAISIRCEDNLLYVTTKEGNLFVFDGDNLVAAHSEKDAVAQGYHWSWFEGKKRNVALIGMTFYTLNSDGSFENKIPLPFDIVWGIYSNYLLPAAMVFAVVLTLYRKKKSKGTIVIPKPL